MHTHSLARATAQQPSHTEPPPYQLDRGSPVALHLQLADAIRTHIHRGTWPAGSRLPSEREVSDLFNVSRITVRAALATLVRERLLIRSAGRGTFVASRQERVTYSALGEVSPHGHEPGAWSVTLLVEDAIADVRSALGLRADAGVTRLSRRRATQSSPCVVETVYLPADRCPQIGIGCELDRLYGTLARDYGIVPTRATLHTEPVISSRSQARQLGIDGGRPIIRLRQTTFDGDGRPFEYVESLVPAVDHSVILVNEGTHPQG